MIAGSVMGYFSDGELFQGMYGLDFSVFHDPLSTFCPMLSSEDALQLCPCSYMLTI